MTPDREYIKIGREYWPVGPGRGTHILRRGRYVPKDYWASFAFNVAVALVFVFSVPALLGLACALAGCP